ncbi:MAG: EscU/YscU/HrcU family type III secretion system export apparatus switch protein, partial [Deltaproteobacteria bacterium]|nr:EscU/YscU/HrcU family type III secretion system export apparatus switch protein [Deltaproteobacteria bacterium]
MAEPRPFPPSVRRSALARAAGLHPASPILVGAIACAVAVIAIGTLGRAAAARLGTWVVAACESPARLAASPEPGLGATALPTAILELALPVLAAIAVAAIVAHLVQTRAVWLPRRRLRGAPTPQPHRVRRTAFDLAAALVIGTVVVGWLWIMAPRLAAAFGSPLAGAALIASLLAALAIAWVVVGTADAIVRHAELAGALRMSHSEKREDDRLSGADPRWRARRAEL